MSDDLWLQIQKQFLVAFPLHNIQWKVIISSLNADISSQKKLLNLTVNHPAVKKHPVKHAYQKSFLRYIINELETQGKDVSDDIYNTYCNMLSPSETSQNNYHFRHYILPTGENIVLQESTSLLSSGTTGLSSWQAGLALAEWCLTNQSELQGKRILELGSGCGLTGLVAAMACDPTEIILSDCHEEVLNQLCCNVSTNLKQVSEPLGKGEKIRAKTKETTVSVFNLPWSEVAQSGIQGPDLLLAADVVFDPSLFYELKEALKHFLTLNPLCCAVLACTIRNFETLNSFLKLLGEEDLCVSQDTNLLKNVFFYDRSTPIHIYKVKYLKYKIV